MLDTLLRLWKGEYLGIKWSWPFAWTGYTKVSNFHFFSDAELAGLQGNLPAMLDQARGIAGIPFVLTSTTGGVHAPNSAHFKGLAADIGLGHLAEGFERDTARFAIVKGCLAAGFQRIEVAGLHIHVDLGDYPDYPNPILWIGPDV